VPLPMEEAPAAEGLYGPPVNLGEVYAHLAQGIQNRDIDANVSVASFEHALKLRRFLRSLQAAVETDESQKADGWPVH